jgi:hypothetical protein
MLGDTEFQFCRWAALSGAPGTSHFCGERFTVSRLVCTAFHGNLSQRLRRIFTHHRTNEPELSQIHKYGIVRLFQIKSEIP